MVILLMLHPSLSITLCNLLNSNYTVTGSSCCGCCPLAKGHLTSSQGGLKQLKLVSDILEMKISPLELKCKTFVLSGENFEVKIYVTHGKLKLIF
jgi:hypothetical protein